MHASINTAIQEATRQLLQFRQNKSEDRPLHGLKEQVIRLIGLLRSAMYPHIFTGDRYAGPWAGAQIGSYLQQAALLLGDMIQAVTGEDATAVTESFLLALPDIAAILATDVQAAYEGDPAAKSTDEIMLAYPAFEAISIFRLAHGLHERGVPLIPRMMTEYAHQTTGVDIHPGASIGPWFFIDHGTGVVIGETCTIGQHVKLYQGVTLGAKSFEADTDGNPIKGIKRHPDIGNHVVVYAGATILGGDTVIGDNCVIGGNVWLTASVPPGTTVYNQPTCTYKEG